VGEPVILALDAGTSSVRAIAFDRAGRAVARQQEEVASRYPRPGWVEQDPEEIWEKQRRVARAVCESVGEVAAIGITNQRETTVVWNRLTGKPVYNAIVWQDRRTADTCAHLLSEGWEETVRGKTGLVLDPYFSATKLGWILDNVPGARAAAERGELVFGTVDTFLAWRLTGGRVHATDPSNASRTLLFNIHTVRWDDDLLRALRIPPTMLPEVRETSQIYGQTDEAVLGAPHPIAALVGDQQAATFGQACFAPGNVKNTYGTGNFLLMNTGSVPCDSRHGLLTTVAWSLGGKVTYALEGSIFVTGAAVQWLRDELGLITDAAEIETLALTVPDNGGVYFVPAFAGLGAPYWDPGARGLIIGLTRGSSRAHIARAVLEAVAYQSDDVLRAMRDDSGLGVDQMRVDGGMAVNDLLLQFQADIAGVSVQRPRVIETTAAGAAYLAGLAVGYWESAEEIAGIWQVDHSLEPRMPQEERVHVRRAWERAVERAGRWASPSE